jgi:hypothetical protein
VGLPRTRAGFALSLGLAIAISSCSSEPNLPQGAGARLSEVVSGLNFPTYLTTPPGDLTRLFIVEKGGVIRVVRDGALLPTPFLDISGQVSTVGEQGLFAMAFDPDYASTGRFVVTTPIPPETLGSPISGFPAILTSRTERARR